jgi:hypothetical protein
LMIAAGGKDSSRGNLATTREARQSPASIKPGLVVVCGRPWCQATPARVSAMVK